jgi:hypothetical protein
VTVKVHRNQPVVRVLGTLTGIGFLAMGAFALFGGGALDDYTQDRAIGFGVAALIGGVWAIAVSLFDSDLSGVWCKPPKPLSLNPKRRPSQED